MAVIDEDRRPAGLGMSIRGQAPDVPAIAHRDQRQNRDLAVLEGMERAEQLVEGERLRGDELVEFVPERPRGELDGRQLERLEVDDLVILEPLALVPEHGL